MFNHADTSQRAHGVAFVGSYLPRACGIATFTYDLAKAVATQIGKSQSVIVAAMNDRPGVYEYPDRVKFEINQDNISDYARAAEYLNSSGADVISLQHEYRIFGGEWGSYLLAFVRNLDRPVVMTCHTVIDNPEPEQKEVFTELTARSAKVVVMSNKAATFLPDTYSVDRRKISVIPHGIHDVPFVDPDQYKSTFGLEGRTVLLTFGLLHRDKGIEYMIDALPAIVERHPRITYLVLGSTHPSVVAREGEAYRSSLQRRVRDLGMEEHVLFQPRFVDIDELLKYISAADICVTPYLDTGRITSGALAYAYGSGKAVVSTPYRHAEELLADGRGRIVPPGDSGALSKEILALLDNPDVFESVCRRAYLYCRHMTWPATAVKYVRLFKEIRDRFSVAARTGR